MSAEAPPILTVAGPTASGKSALALALAERLGGTVINADALQVYRDLRILTARPTAADEARAPHRLYGQLDAAEACSAGRWLGLAKAAIAEAEASGRTPILCGGTGLYLKALEQGLARVPPLPAEARTAAAADLARLGATGLHAALAARDPAGAAALVPQDRQRLLRAWAVLQTTGRPLSHWQAAGGEGGRRLRWVVLLPPRELLRAAVAERWQAMLRAGALAEVSRLLERGLDPALPAMKAVGVRELGEVLAGRLDLAAAGERAVAATRQYLKRQTSWLRTQVLASHAGALTLQAKFSDLGGPQMLKKVLSEA